MPNKHFLSSYDVIFPIGRIVFSTNLSIKSATIQTYPYSNFIIVIDTLDEKLVNDIKNLFLDIPRTIILRSYKKGPAFARNLAISNSNSEFLAFLDSDDIWHKNKMKEQMKSIKLNNSNFCFTSYIAANSNLSKPIFLLKYFFKAKKVQLFFSNPIGNSSVVISRKLLLKAGGYVEISSRNDFATWINVFSEESLSINYLNQVLCIIAKNKNSVSNSKNQIITIYGAFKKIYSNKIFSIVCTISFCTFQLFTKLIRKLFLFIFLESKYKNDFNKYLIDFEFF